MTPQEAHSKGTSASSASYDRLCPGRWRAQAGIPDTQTEYAASGSKIHAALAENGRTGQEATFSLTTEERDLFDACREVEKKVIAQVFGGEPDSSNRVWREQRYWAKIPAEDIDVSKTLRKEIKLFDHSGQADMVMRRNDVAIICDYKAGRLDVVESPKNEQLRDLAVMVWRTLVVKEVVVFIDQPLDTWSPELCRYDEASLKQAEQEMWERVRASNDPNAKRIPGDEQCRYCRAVAICNEHAAWKSALLPVEKENPLTVAPSFWTPSGRALVAEHLPRLKKLLADAEDALKASLEADPESVPGFYLKPGAARKPINNPQELFNRFSALATDKAAAMAVENDALNHPEFHEANLILGWFMQCVEVKKGEFEAQVRAASGKKGKSLKTEVEKLLEGIVDEKPVAPSLAKKKEEK